MSPTTPLTRTRLNPAYPLLWRDGESIQFGLEGIVRVDASAAWVEPLVQALSSGFRPSAFDVIAHGVGAPRDAARALLAALQPVLLEDPPVPPSVWVEAVNIADPRTETRVRDALTDEGIRVTDRHEPNTIGVILLEGAASAFQLAHHLQNDIAHLPIAFEPGSFTVGPLVRPGITPCLSCRDGHERDADPAWPLLHGQLIGMPAGPISAARVAEAAGLAARIAVDPLSGDRSHAVRVSPSGHRVRREVRFHAECRCRERSFRSPQENETASAPLAPRRATTTVTAFAQPA